MTVTVPAGSVGAHGVIRRTGGLSHLLDLAAYRPAWHADAACREHPDVAFVAEDIDPRPAKAICSTCLVRTECLAAGAAELGVWGGTTEHERPNTPKARRTAVVRAAQARRTRPAALPKRPPVRVTGKARERLAAALGNPPGLKPLQESIKPLV